MQMVLKEGLLAAHLDDTIIVITRSDRFHTVQERPYHHLFQVRSMVLAVPVFS